VRAEATIKTVWERIRQNSFWKQKITSRKLKAEHIDPIKSCLIRDDLHMRAHFRSMGHLLTPALNRQTRAKHLLQWHAKNGHGNILLTDEKIFTIEEQCKIYAETSLEVCSEGGNSTTRFMLKLPLRCVLSVGPIQQDLC